MNPRHLTAAAVALCLAVPGASFATNGYFAHGYGTKNKGMAGSGVAFPQDSLASATNPAGNVWVGERIDLGVALFSPHRDYTVVGSPSPAPAFDLMPGSYDSSNELFLIPSFGWNTLIDENSSFGVAVYGNGGMNTEWSDTPSPGTFYGGMVAGADDTAGVDLSQLFVNLSYSRKINDRASWGAGLVLAAQAFEATGLASFGTMVADGNPDDLTDNGHDISYGAGLKLGLQGELNEWVTLGASYQSRIWMTELDDYSDLFAEDGDFDIPPTATIGLAVKPAENHTITFDIQHIWYSDIDSIANPMTNLTVSCMGGSTSYCLGGSNGVGFGWDDMTIFKLGWQWHMNDTFTVRAGYSHGEQPIPDSEVMFNILAPGVMEQHFTVGFTMIPSKGHELNFAAMYAPKESVTGTNPMDPAQTIELEMDQWDLEVSWTWLF
jgi:long-chain fatty acid transport protein